MIIKKEIGNQPGKFLIVDDHAEFRRMIRVFLPAGVVTECSDGIQVMACYEANRPDWVLMDIEMAGMDGLTATGQLMARFPEARVIVVSHHDGEDLRGRARKLGARGFVNKEHLELLLPLINSNKIDGETHE